MRTQLALPTVAAALLLAGCSSIELANDTEPLSSASASSAAPASSASSVESSIGADWTPDGSCSSSGDEVEVALAVDGTAVNVTATFSDGALPDVGEFSVVVMASKYDEDGNGNMIIATAKWVDGDKFVSIFDMATAMQENLPEGNASLVGNVVTASFDVEPFDDLGDGWTWKATVTEAGMDTFSCEP